MGNESISHQNFCGQYSKGIESIPGGQTQRCHHSIFSTFNTSQGKSYFHFVFRYFIYFAI